MNPRPRIIFVSGLPGSGKSYFAGRFAPDIGAVYLSSDLIRKELFPHPTYSSTEKEQVYAAMSQRMHDAVAGGKSVVLDATFHRKDLRDRFRGEISALAADPFWILVTAEEDKTFVRVSQPREHSDADWNVYLRLKADFEPLEPGYLHLGSDAEDVAAMIGLARDFVGISALNN